MMLEMWGSDGLKVIMKGMLVSLLTVLFCKVSMRGMSGARCICLVTKLRLYPHLRRYEVSSVARVLKVSSIEQIRRKRSARLEVMAFSSSEDDKMNKVNVDVCL